MPVLTVGNVIWITGNLSPLLVPLAAGGLALVIFHGLLAVMRRWAGRTWPVMEVLPWLGAMAAAAAAFPLGRQTGWHLPALLILAVLAVWGTWQSYASNSRLLTGLQKSVLTGLRLLAVLLVLGLLLRPAWQETWKETEPPLVLLLQDTSASMTTADAGSPRQPVSRYDAGRQAWHQATPALRRLSERADVLAYQFGRELQPVVMSDGRPDWPPQADQPRTNVCGLLQQACEEARRRGRPPVGVLLVSDGAENVAPPMSADVLGALLARQGLPLVAVGVGSEWPTSHTQGLYFRGLRHPPRGAIKRTMTVQADLLALGLKNEPLRLTLSADGRKVAEQVFTPSDERERKTVEWPFTPERLGSVALLVTAETTGGKQNQTKPASAVSVVQIVPDRLRVLAVEAKPRHEFAALVRALSADEMVDLKSLPAFSTEPGCLLSRYHLPFSVKEWKNYDVVIVGDVPADRWGGGQLAGLAEAVAEGCGFIMLGGLSNYGSYAGTPLAAVLPISNLPKTGEIERPIRVLPAPNAQSDPICLLDTDGSVNADLWPALPPLPGAARFEGVKPGAKVLLSGTEENGQCAVPIAVWQQYGKGRVLALAGDQFWTWQRVRDDGGRLLQRFWSQAVMQVTPPQGQVWVAGDQSRYELADLKSGRVKVNLEAGVNGPAADKAVLKVTWRGPLNPSAASQPSYWQEVTLTGPMTGQKGSLRVEQAGRYELHAVAEAEGKMVGESQAAFQVVETDYEQLDRLADFDLLRRLAEPTRSLSGGFLPVARLADGLDRLAGQDRQTMIARTREITLRDLAPGWIFALFLATLAAEWLLRKKWGLV